MFQQGIIRISIVAATCEHGIACLWCTTNEICAKNGTLMYVARLIHLMEWKWHIIFTDSNDKWLNLSWPVELKSDHSMWSLLLFAAAVWSFVNLLLRLSDHNSVKLIPHTVACFLASTGFIYSLSHIHSACYKGSKLLNISHS